MKELTLKQLYGYSIMNWEEYLFKIIKIEADRCCSFCRNVEKREKGKEELDCSKGDCKLNPFLCYDSGNRGYFNKINNTEIILYDQIRKLIHALKIEYNKL